MSLFNSVHFAIWKFNVTDYHSSETCAYLLHCVLWFHEKNKFFESIPRNLISLKLAPTLETFFYKRAGCAVKWLMISSQPTVPPWSTYKKGMTTKYNWKSERYLFDCLYKECQFEIVTLVLKLFNSLIYASKIWFCSKVEGYFDQKAPNGCRRSLFLWIKQ